MIDLAVPDIVSDMIQKFYAGGHNSTHKWFTSTRDLPGIVYNFLRTRDCFIDSHPYPSVEITFTHDLSSEYDRKGSSMTIIGDVKWFPPVIEYSNVPAALPIGAEYRIAGTYFGPELTGSFVAFLTEVVYNVESESLPLAWDSTHGYFRAFVPDVNSSIRTQEAGPQITNPTTLNGPRRDSFTGPSDLNLICNLETKFFAQIIMKFPDNVRFETVTRYKLYLGVLPKHRAHAPLLRPTRLHHIPGPPSDDSSSGDTASIHLSPQQEREEAGNHAEATKDTGSAYPSAPAPYQYHWTGTTQVLPAPSTEGRARQISPKRKQPTSPQARSASPEPRVTRLSPPQGLHLRGGLSPKRQRRMERVDSGNGSVVGPSGNGHAVWPSCSGSVIGPSSNGSAVLPSVDLHDEGHEDPCSVLDEVASSDLLARSRRSQAPSPPVTQEVAGTGVSVIPGNFAPPILSDKFQSPCDNRKMAAYESAVPILHPSTTQDSLPIRLPRFSKTPFAATSEEEPATSPTHQLSIPPGIFSSSNSRPVGVSAEERFHAGSQAQQQQNYGGSPTEQRMRKYRNNYEEFMRQKCEREQMQSLPTNSRLDGALDEEDTEIAKAFLDGNESSPLESSGEEYESHSDTSDPMKESTIFDGP